MNSLEKYIYDKIKANPQLKDLIRDIYQSMFLLVPGKREKAQFPIIKRPGYFFGFHDKNPFSMDNAFLLSNHFEMPLRHPLPSDSIEIGVFSGQDYLDFSSLGKTSAFNWQQGCMLQWLGGSKDTFIYNGIDKNHDIHIIANTKGENIGNAPFHISSVSENGQLGISYNFGRLSKYFSGYGYAGSTDKELSEFAPKSHGISMLNLQRGHHELLFSVDDISKINPEHSMLGAHHFITHGLFSPGGNRILFLHRWMQGNSFLHTRLFTCNADGSELYLLPTTGMVSHMSWQNNNSLLAYARVMEGDKYVLFKDQSSEYEIIGDDSFNSDGHPFFSPIDQNIFVTDTYPDKYRYSYLILYNLIQAKRIDIASLKQPFKFRNEIRCDLHPRWDRSGSVICFDSAHNGHRSLCTITVDKPIFDL